MSLRIKFHINLYSCLSTQILLCLHVSIHLLQLNDEFGISEVLCSISKPTKVNLIYFLYFLV
jgi:hypothetical protein